MGDDVETIKQRLDIAEVVGGYVKLEKAGASFKGRCPFHSEKTPSFFVSPSRGSYYCFGCGAKGDIFTFVEEMEGVNFREALKSLAERAGVELKGVASRMASGEKESLHQVLEIAAEFFEVKLKENADARNYLLSRGLTDSTITSWRLGYAPAEWRALYNDLVAKGFKKELLIKAGLAKPVTEPYDVFRDRLIFPLSDASGNIIAFSGRALSIETEPKYLNSPDTVLFTKSDVLYGLSKAKDEIRKKNYAVLVEGQMDLVLSHQAGVKNAVASSGTAFTAQHLERLKRLSPRIILAFDGDAAGEKAADKSTHLALSLGLEVKIAKLPPGSDPADLAKQAPESWKEVLRQAKPAIEHFLDQILEREADRRKQGLLIQRELLPKLAILSSSIERSHFVSLISRKTGIKEDVIWEDLRKVKNPELSQRSDLGKESLRSDLDAGKVSVSREEKIQERLTEVRTWLKELPESGDEALELKKEERELLGRLKQEALHDELRSLTVSLAQAETSKDEAAADKLARQVSAIHKELQNLEGKEESL